MHLQFCRQTRPDPHQNLASKGGRLRFVVFVFRGEAESALEFVGRDLLRAVEAARED